jgi:excisionase family DNA binding protein
MSVQDLCTFLGVSKSFIYKLSSLNVLPKYCPNGKILFFKKTDVIKWIEKNRIPSDDELQAEADLILYKNKKGS